jgi:hypothetical protein
MPRISRRACADNLHNINSDRGARFRRSAEKKWAEGDHLRGVQDPSKQFKRRQIHHGSQSTLVPRDGAGCDAALKYISAKGGRLSASIRPYVDPTIRVEREDRSFTKHRAYPFVHEGTTWRRNAFPPRNREPRARCTARSAVHGVAYPRK